MICGWGRCHAWILITENGMLGGNLVQRGGRRQHELGGGQPDYPSRVHLALALS
jgi:hypothetical protein